MQDLDPVETQEWLDSLESVLDKEGEDRAHYHTLGGLVMLALGRVPRTGDVFERAEHRFEVVDMDGNRVDRVLVSPPPTRHTPPVAE